MAGNQLGKTLCAGNETACHLTGLYPDWWDGRVFPKAPRFWVGSLTSELTRDGAQRILLGPTGKWGTGTIPKELIVEIKRARGVPDSVESVLIKHVNGDVGQITFKAYSDGREAWQAETLDGVWYDEEPPEGIYIEGITRTNATNGMVYTTFTPLLGMSNVVMRFVGEAHKDRAIINMTIDDVLHYSEEQRQRVIDSYPPHELEARTLGKPMLGSGAIFPIATEVIAEPQIENPPQHWKHLIGCDFGYDHPFAAVKILYDQDSDCIHVTNAYRIKHAGPIIHAATLRSWGTWVPVSWPHDGLIHDKGSCVVLADQYKQQGLKMISEHATFGDDRGNGVEAGISEMLMRMQTNRFKVANHLSEWFEEFRMFHRNKGKVVKERDDLMAATRYAVMMLRYAIPGTQAPGPMDRYRMKSAYSGGQSWMAN